MNELSAPISVVWEITNNCNYKCPHCRAYQDFSKNDEKIEDIIINVQGDEPFIHPEQIETVMQCFNQASTDIATLVKPFDKNGSYEELANPNSVKVVFDLNMHALYFSRSVIPHLRGVDQALWPSSYQYFTHLGMYAYRSSALRDITAMTQSSLETNESLEQLRWLENGLRIKVGITSHSSIGIDTPQDLERAELFLSSNQ